MFAERKPDWPFTPSLLQVYVDDLDTVLERATARGATLITNPTDFFGARFARVQDASANLRWIWQHGEADWSEGESDWTVEGSAGGWEEISAALAYIHDTLNFSHERVARPKGGSLIPHRRTGYANVCRY